MLRKSAGARPGRLEPKWLRTYGGRSNDDNDDYDGNDTLVMIKMAVLMMSNMCAPKSRWLATCLRFVLALKLFNPKWAPPSL